MVYPQFEIVFISLFAFPMAEYLLERVNDISSAKRVKQDFSLDDSVVL